MLKDNRQISFFQAGAIDTFLFMACTFKNMYRLELLLYYGSIYLLVNVGQLQKKLQAAVTDHRIQMVLKQ